jgi:HEAT repeat protein
MTRFSLVLGLTAVAAAGSLPAQSLSRRILDASDGPIQFSFASRDGVCGDGSTYVRDGFGGNNRIYEGGNFNGHSRGDDWPPCIPGPVHVVASMSGGQLLRLRTYAGPRRSGDSPPRDLGLVSVADAADFLTRVVEQARGRPSSDAILPLVLADSINPWPTLLRFARDERLPHSIRSTVDFWLARGAAARLGVADHDDEGDDEIRAQAVFALSQQPKETAVPQLIEIVRHNTHPSARAQALFWLGQSGDTRAVDLFDEILRRP